MLKLRINGELQEFADIEELEGAIECAIDEVSADAYDDGVFDGKDDGYDDGYEAARRVLIPEQENSHRETGFRRDLYRAIFAGNVEEAENIANLMAMVGIDRDLIWEARKHLA